MTTIKFILQFFVLCMAFLKSDGVEKGCRPVLQKFSFHQLAKNEPFFKNTYSNPACPDDFVLLRCVDSCLTCPGNETCMASKTSNRPLQTQIGDNVYAFNVEEHLECFCSTTVSGVHASDISSCAEESKHVALRSRNVTRCDSVTIAGNEAVRKTPYLVFPTLLTFSVVFYQGFF